MAGRSEYNCPLALPSNKNLHGKSFLLPLLQLVLLLWPDKYVILMFLKQPSFSNYINILHTKSRLSLEDSCHDGICCKEHLLVKKLKTERRMKEEMNRNKQMRVRKGVLGVPCKKIKVYLCLSYL